MSVGHKKSQRTVIPLAALETKRLVFTGEHLPAASLRSKLRHVFAFQAQ
jgi:hypothetical protein